MKDHIRIALAGAAVLYGACGQGQDCNDSGATTSLDIGASYNQLFMAPSNASCDVNMDGVVDAGDTACTISVALFGTNAMQCGAGLSAEVTIGPCTGPNMIGEQKTCPVTIDSEVVALTVEIDYDENKLGNIGVTTQISETANCVDVAGVARCKWITPNGTERMGEIFTISFDILEASGQSPLVFLGQTRAGNRDGIELVLTTTDGNAMLPVTLSGFRVD